LSEWREEQFQTQQATLQAKLDALEAKAGGTGGV
jgi:hypothetical protein